MSEGQKGKNGNLGMRIRTMRNDVSPDRIDLMVMAEIVGPEQKVCVQREGRARRWNKNEHVLGGMSKLDWWKGQSEVG